ncbi:AAA family ATPase [Sinorhizobium medicae]|nr:AAA family ATPase [Sinorhizobium medicae]MDX0826573.1 AAA family ATPase [Sinorhizobium medicae]
MVARVEQQETKTRFELIWAHDIGDEDDHKVWFVRDVFAEGEFSYIVGLPGAGKSNTATDIACHLAAGWDWHGRKVKEPRMVLYIAAERARLTRRRIKAWRKKHDHTGRLNVLVLSGYVNLTKDLSDVKDFAGIIEDAEDRCGMKCGLVIIDTLTRVFGGGDQNAAKDMGKLIDSVAYLQEQVPEPHVCVIHHTTHAGERAKGAIDLDGAVDVSFSVSKRNGAHVFTNTGTNDGVEGDLLAFKFDSVTLGKDEDGEWTTAPVLYQVDEIPAKQEDGDGSADRAAILTAIRKLADSGADGVLGDMVPKGLVRAEFDRMKPGKPESQKAQFNRAFRELVRDELISSGGYGSAALVKIEQK